MNRSHRHYEVYGLRVCSSISLPELQGSSFHFKDVVFSFEVETGTSHTLLQGPAELLLRRLTSQGDYFALFDMDGSYLLRWEGNGEFLISHDGKTIQALAPSTTSILWVRGTLYGIVLSFALHLMGIANLHASGVVLPEGAVGFLADPGTGKSTFAASFVRKGFDFLCDDVITIQGGARGYEAFSGFPFMSLDDFSMEVIFRQDSTVLPTPSPEHAVGDKQRVSCSEIGGQFHGGSAPLRGLFVLARGDNADGAGSVTIQRLSRREALKCLLENTVFLPVLPVPVTKRHMAYLAELTDTLPVWRLQFANGFGNLPEMMEKVLEAVRAEQSLAIGV